MQFDGMSLFVINEENMMKKMMELLKKFKSISDEQEKRLWKSKKIIVDDIASIDYINLKICNGNLTVISEKDINSRIIIKYRSKGTEDININRLKNVIYIDSNEEQFETEIVIIIPMNIDKISYKVNSGNGRVSFNKIQAPDIMVSLKNGDIGLIDFAGKNINLNTELGNIIIKNIVIKNREKIKAITNNGNIKIIVNDFCDTKIVFKVKAINGMVKNNTNYMSYMVDSDPISIVECLANNGNIIIKKG